MAIYHFSAKVIGRANGSSALASAAYRSASRLYDQRLDRHHDFSNKSGVIHSEVMTPADVPDGKATYEPAFSYNVTCNSGAGEMGNLTTTFMGLTLSSPLVASASPLCNRQKASLNSKK